jgi:hypothetical protein
LLPLATNRYANFMVTVLFLFVMFFIQKPSSSSNLLKDCIVLMSKLLKNYLTNNSLTECPLIFCLAGLQQKRYTWLRFYVLVEFMCLNLNFLLLY